MNVYRAVLRVNHFLTLFSTACRYPELGRDCRDNRFRF
jgi:hypothetical protein